MKTIGVSPRLFAVTLACAYALSLTVPLFADEPNDAPLPFEWSQGLEQARQKVALDGSRAMAEVAAQNAAAEKKAGESDAARRKELTRSLLQEQITKADGLARWGFIVPADQTIAPHLAWWDRIPVFGDAGYGDVKFDVIYKGARMKLTCELDMDPQSHVVEVKFCEPPLFPRQWPKTLRVDRAAGILFSDAPKSNSLILYIDMSDLVP